MFNTFGTEIKENLKKDPKKVAKTVLGVIAAIILIILNDNRDKINQKYFGIAVTIITVIGLTALAIISFIKQQKEQENLHTEYESGDYLIPGHDFGSKICPFCEQNNSFLIQKEKDKYIYQCKNIECGKTFYTKNIESNEELEDDLEEEIED